MQGYTAYMAPAGAGLGVGFVIRSPRAQRNKPTLFPVLRVSFPSPRCGILETRQHGIRISIIAAYAPTAASVKDHRAFWDTVDETIREARGRVILLGDLNAQIPSRVRMDPPNENGQALQNLAQQRNMCFRSLQFDQHPTHKLWTWRGNLPDEKKPRIIDYIISSEEHALDTTAT